MINKLLRDKLLKNTTIESTDILENSVLFSEKDLISTSVPMINVGLSGSFNGGLAPGLFMLAGPSKHFKTGFSLLMITSFLQKYSDGIILFYDSEFGAPSHYFDTFSIPKDQVVHTPITNLEELKHDIATQLKNIQREDNVLIFVDSLGSTASLKETTDAEDGKTTSDMTRAKQIKSLFRIVTPHLSMKNIPMVCVNHTYQEIGPMYPRQIVGGGQGPYLSANDIWILGRQKDKDGTELTGFNFIINIEKSRFVKEGSKIPVTISFDEGIYKWSGLFDNAIEAGFITSPSKGWYQTKDSDKKIRREDLESNDAYWESLIHNEEFEKFIKNKYSLLNEA